MRPESGRDCIVIALFARLRKAIVPLLKRMIVWDACLLHEVSERFPQGFMVEDSWFRVEGLRFLISGF